MTQDEQRAYSKGYAAGRRKTAMAFNRDIADRRRERFRQHAALAALTAIMHPNMKWGYTDKDGNRHNYSTAEEFAKGSFAIADCLLKHTYFDSGPFAEGADEAMG